MRKKANHKGMPFSLSIEPTTACNLGCPECPSGLKQFTRPTGKLDLNLHKKMLDELKNTVFFINYYFQGEPFLHPNFLELIKEAKRNKIYTEIIYVEQRWHEKIGERTKSEAKSRKKSTG